MAYEYVPSTLEADVAALNPFFERYKAQRAFRNFYPNDPVSSGDERQEPNNIKYVDVEFYPDSMQAEFLSDSPASLTFAEHLKKNLKNVIRISRKVNTRMFDYTFTYIQYPGVYRDDIYRNRYAIQKMYYGTILITGIKQDIDSEQGEVIPFSVRASVYNANESSNPNNETDLSSDGPELQLGFMYDTNYIYIFPKSFMPYRYIPCENVDNPSMLEYLDIYSLLRLRSPIFTNPDWDSKEVYRDLFVNDYDFGINFVMNLTLKDYSYGFVNPDIEVIVPSDTIKTDLYQAKAQLVNLSPNSETLLRLDGIGMKSRKTGYRPNERYYEFFSHYLKDNNEKTTGILYEQPLFVSLQKILDDDEFVGSFEIGQDRYALIMNKSTKEILIHSTDDGLTNFVREYSFTYTNVLFDQVYATKSVEGLLYINGSQIPVIILYGQRGFYILNKNTKNIRYFDSTNIYSNADLNDNRLDMYSVTGKDSYTFTDPSFNIAPTVTSTFKLNSPTNAKAVTGVAPNTVDVTWEWGLGSLPNDPNRQIVFQIYKNNKFCLETPNLNATIDTNINAMEHLTIVACDKRTSFAFLPSDPTSISITAPLNPINAATLVVNFTDTKASVVFQPIGTKPSKAIPRYMVKLVGTTRSGDDRVLYAKLDSVNSMYSVLFENLYQNRDYTVEIVVEDGSGIYMSSSKVSKSGKTQRTILPPIGKITYKVIDNVVTLKFSGYSAPEKCSLQYIIRKVGDPTIIWAANGNNLPTLLGTSSTELTAKIGNIPYQTKLKYSIQVIDTAYSDSSWYANSKESTVEFLTAYKPVAKISQVGNDANSLTIQLGTNNSYKPPELPAQYKTPVIEVYVSKNKLDSITRDDILVGRYVSVDIDASKILVPNLLPGGEYYIKTVVRAK